LHVLSSTTAHTQEVAPGALWAQLWGFDSQNNAIPDLLSEVPTVSNGDVKKIEDSHMDVTIKLKSGLKWSDGQSLTTKDISFTFNAICDPQTGAASQLGYSSV